MDPTKMESGWRKCKVNLTLLPIKVHYFIFMAGLSAVLPFRTIFAKQLGISATAVGVVFTAVPFLRIITNPFFGALLDRFKNFHSIISIIMFIMGASHLGMIFIPPLRSTNQLMSKSVNISCDPILSEEIQENVFMEKIVVQNCFSLQYVKECPMNCKVCSDPLIEHFLYQSKEQNRTVFSINCKIGSLYILRLNLVFPPVSKLNVFHIRVNNVTINRQNIISDRLQNHNYTHCFCNDERSCSSTKIDPEFMTCHENENETNKSNDQGVFITYQFWTFLVLMVLSSVAFSAVMFIVDAVCYENLNNNPEKYGEQRLWGTLGWGIGALVGGYLNQLASPSPTATDYSPGFYFLVALSIFDLAPLWFIQFRNVKYSSSILKDVGMLFRNRFFSANIIIVYFVGILSGLVWNYQNWFLEEIGASQLLLGLSQTFECVFAEVPCFFFGGRIAKRIGHANCVTLALVCFAVRYLCLAYMRNPWLSLPVGLLHGPTFGIFYTSMTMYAKSKAVPGTEVTVQSLMSTTFEGVGAATGSILGGIGIDAFGSRMTFTYAAFSSLCLLVINIFVMFLFQRWNPSDPSNEKNDITKFKPKV